MTILPCRLSGEETPLVSAIAPICGSRAEKFMMSRGINLELFGSVNGVHEDPGSAELMVTFPPSLPRAVATEALCASSLAK